MTDERAERAGQWVRRFLIGCTDGVEGYERQASRLGHKWDSFISDGSGGEEYFPYALGQRT